MKPSYLWKMKHGTYNLEGAEVLFELPVLVWLAEVPAFLGTSVAVATLDCECLRIVRRPLRGI